jgi:hypothetical protein
LKGTEEQEGSEAATVITGQWVGALNEITDKKYY